MKVFRIVHPVARRAFLACFALLFTCMLTLPALGQDNLLGVLKKKYTVTQITLDGEQIASPGVIFAIQANGINAEPYGTLVKFDNPVVDGAVQQRNKFTGFLKTPNMLILQPGEKVYVTKIEGVASAKNDTIKFAILSCDPKPINGGASQKRYSATVSFKLQAGGLAQISPDVAERMVEAIMAPDGGGSQEAAAAAAPAPPPPPPPPPPAATQTIALGQTISQVVSSMGQPTQIIDLGTKKTYIYPGLKVIFINGKVSDVQ